MYYMFYNCKNLNTLDISSFDFSNVTSYSNIFNSMKSNATIYVKDETARTWVLNLSSDNRSSSWSTSNVLLKTS